MSKRLNISIPDELHEDLGKYKGKINISQICQGALREHINLKEEIKKKRERGTTMTELIERLKSGKEDKKETWIDHGIEEGAYWTKNWADYDAIQVVINASDFNGAEQQLKNIDDTHINYFDDDLKENFSNTANEVEELESWDWDCEEYQLFKEGWMKGVLDIWEDIKDDVEE